MDLLATQAAPYHDHMLTEGRLKFNKKSGNPVAAAHKEEDV